MMKVIT